MSDQIKFGFITSRGKGGQHTNGPDYGKVTAENEAFGIRIEIQTCSSFGQHKARDLAASLLELAAGDMK